MVGRKKDSTIDAARGSRFAEELDKLYSGSSRTAKARNLSVGESALRRAEAGSNIDNRLLASLMDAGADVGYIIGANPKDVAPTGQAGADRHREEQILSSPIFPPAKDCPNGGLCEQIATLLQLLGGRFRASLSDRSRLEQLKAQVDIALSALQEKPKSASGGELPA